MPGGPTSGASHGRYLGPRWGAARDEAKSRQQSQANHGYLPRPLGANARRLWSLVGIDQESREVLAHGAARLVDDGFDLKWRESTHGVNQLGAVGRADYPHASLRRDNAVEERKAARTGSILNDPGLGIDPQSISA